MMSLKEGLKQHFNSAYESIKYDLCEVAPELKENDSRDYTFDGTNVGNWKCPICKTENLQKA